MRLRTRAFLLSFLPFAILLSASFWTIQSLVQSTVREGLRKSMRENQIAIGHIRAKARLQNEGFLKIAGENAALRAGLQLMQLEKNSREARLTVEDQLRDLSVRMDFDFLLASGPDGKPLAAVSRSGPMDVSQVPVNPGGFVQFGGQAYQVASVALEQSNDTIGFLAVGERFSLAECPSPAVLMRGSAIVLSSIEGVAPAELETALATCAPDRECDFRLRDAHFLSLPVPGFSPGGGYLVRIVENEDEATAALRGVLRNVFASVLAVSLLLAGIVGAAASRSMVGPIAAVVSHLRAAETTGLLPEFREDLSSVLEIRELTNSFNATAASIREARENLQNATVQAVEALASALDARDEDTAGHSQRVSRISCGAARVMGLDAEYIERIRVGALLHDIGKIGIRDAVLQKPGPLTPAEYDIIKLHPVIGKHILEGVLGFAPYLDAVELHHENWDGTGYPWGQVGEQTPLDARIIHVADSYDAMTSDRPYRAGIPHDLAIKRLQASAGRMFDPAVVDAVASLPPQNRVVRTQLVELTEPVLSLT